ncbi:MAG: twin-arginine translocase TatA/TatE family subunit [Armatimonadota bacterium]
MTLFAFLGTQEIVVVLVLALLVFGPQKLPDIGRQLGGALRELKKLSGDFQQTLDFDPPGPASGTYGYDGGDWHRQAALPETPEFAAPPGPAGRKVSSESPFEEQKVLQG